MNFDNYARTWDTDKRIERAKIISEKIASFTQIDKKCSAMEFGCGTGIISFNLVEKFENITLIDLSKGMIDIVKDKIKKHAIKNMHPYVLDLFNDAIDEKFDFIYSSMVLHHIQDISGLVSKFYSLLNDGGQICIVDLDKEDGSFHKNEPGFNGHNGFDQEELKKIFIKVGFENVESTTFFYDEKQIEEENIKYSLFIMKATKKSSKNIQNEKDFKKLEKVLVEKEEKQEFSGVVLISEKNKETFSGSYGYANKSWSVKNTLDTKFRIASVSKMFTSVAILQLIEKGKINFETKVVEYLKLKNTKISNEVTVENLLTHTSGIGDYFDESLGDEEWERMWRDFPIYKMRTNEDYLPLFINRDLVEKPNEKYHYNGAGYILLGLVIEKASGLTYFDYVKKNIFEKSDMKDSDFLSLDKVYEKVAEGYELVRDSKNNIVEWEKNIYKTTPDGAADGGATSTAHDLVKFMKALRKNKLLGKEMSKAMFTPKVVDEEANGARGHTWMYGYGNSFVLDKEGKNIIRCGHTGEEYGVSARLYYYPKEDITVVILANQGWCAGALGWDIHSALSDRV